MDDELKMELINAENAMQSVLYRINNDLDFFGNPVGWVPMLSFEVNKLAFEQEIDKAVRVLYLSYWLKNIEGSNEQRINACNEAIKQVRQELADNKDALNRFVNLIPDLQEETNAIVAQMEQLQIRIEQKQAELLARAKDNISKKNRLNIAASALKVVAAVAPLIPVVGTAVSAVAMVGSNMLAAKANGGNVTESFFSTMGDLYKQGVFSDNISSVLDKFDIPTADLNLPKLKTDFNTLEGCTKPLMESAQSLYTVLMNTSAPNSEIKAELDRLMSESKEYRELIAEAEVLKAKQEELVQKVSTTLNDIVSASTYIQKDVLAIDGLSRDVFNGNSKRDLRAMQYLDDMERRAKERLLKYHYYMGKSYEYRLLKPYTAELNLSAMVDRFAAIAEVNPDKPVLDAQDFQNLKAVYEEQLSTVTANILNEYNLSRQEVTGPIRFSMEKADLDQINAGNDILLNIFERGMIGTNQENVRIVDFKIYSMKVHTEGSLGSLAYFDLSLEHSGISKLRQNGEIYWFNHISNQTQNPITWGMRYDAINNITNSFEPSFANQSLLYSLLDKLGKKGDIMIYSRPGAWADIRISKQDVTTLSNTKMIIDELIFELQYDFVQRPTSNRNLDVYAGDVEKSTISLSPYIKVSRADKNNRSNSRGVFYRTYNSGTTLNLEAPEEYGRWKFVNWTNRFGEVVAAKALVNVNMSNDNALTANYQYMDPILSLKDTVKIGKSAKVVTVKVENKGSEEMEWTAVSNTPWIKIISGAKGIDTDYITLEVELNESGTKRSGSITVTAPETAEYAKEVVILQLNEDITGISNSKDSETFRLMHNSGSDIYTGLLNQPAQNISLNVYSVSGQLVLRNYFYNTAIFDFNLSHCTEGVYVVSLVCDGKNYVRKIVR